MHLHRSSYRRLACCVLTVTITLPASMSALTQAAQTVEWSFPAQGDQKIVIWNAFIVTIDAWQKDEISITSQVLDSTIRREEISVKPEGNKIDISCHPDKDDRKIFLRVRAPVKAMIEIHANGNAVEVREPTGEIIVSNATKELIQLSAPESAAVDMREAPRASIRRRLAQGGGIVQMSMGKGQISGGPPFLKVSAARASVAVQLGDVTRVSRPPTLAATTIAHRNTAMSKALRESAPELIRPSARSEQIASVAKPDDGPEGALKLETYLVNLNVSVTDRVGKAILDLNRDNFTVYEDGEPQLISFFAPQQAPFNLVLLLDLSGSVRDQFELIRKTALSFLDASSSQDSISIVTFTTDVTVVSRLTKDREDLRDSIELMLAPAGGTAFYDALGYVLVEILRKVKGQRNAVIAITDGEDNALQQQLVTALRPLRPGVVTSGSFLTFDQLLEGATEADALIFPIHLNPALPQVLFGPPGNRPPPTQSPFLQVQPEMTEIATKQLQALADASGGRLYHANRIEDLKGVFEQIAAELRTVYSVAYTPKNLSPDGKFRKIRVLVNRPDVGIRTRPGYYAK